MKFFITGISGFVGGHLAQYLLNETNHEVAGCSLNGPSAEFSMLFDDAAPRVHGIDIADDAIGGILAREQPDALVHLAAHAQVAGSWQHAAGIIEKNAVATQVLMEAVRENIPEARILQISSGDVYGSADADDMPLRESTMPRPNNPYSVSKLAQEFIALQYHSAFDMAVIAARPFNHIGPRQTGDFITPSVARQLARIEAGLQEPVIAVGNLDSRRDFLDVRDVVRAYVAIIEKGGGGELYNVCSGVPRSVSDIVSILLELSSSEVELRQDPDRMRPSDSPVLFGDASRLESLGWSPGIELWQSLSDILAYWRRRVALEAAAGKKD